MGGPVAASSLADRSMLNADSEAKHGEALGLRREYRLRDPQSGDRFASFSDKRLSEGRR